MLAPTTHATSARVLTLSLPSGDCCAVALQAPLSMPALHAGASGCCLHRQTLQCTSSSAATDGARPQLQPFCGHPVSPRLAKAVLLQVRYELGLQVQLSSVRSGTARRQHETAVLLLKSSKRALLTPASAPKKVKCIEQFRCRR